MKITLICWLSMYHKSLYLDILDKCEKIKNMETFTCKYIK